MDATSSFGGTRSKVSDSCLNKSRYSNGSSVCSKEIFYPAGWTKQALIEVREAGAQAISQLNASNSNFLTENFDLKAIEESQLSYIEDHIESLSLSSLSTSTRYSYNSQLNSSMQGGYPSRSNSIIEQLEKSKILFRMIDQEENVPLTILHFNDVYNVDPITDIEPIGGAARFYTAVKSFAAHDPLVLFSGDIFSPSMLSTFTQGEQMVPVLNSLGTHCAVFGNHDFDHGLDILTELTRKTNFPWLMSNVIDNETGRPLGGGKISHFILHNQLRIGLIGLVEKEWLDTLATIDPKELTYIDYIEVGNSLTAELRNEGCEIIIALTHMRTPNDIKLAENCPDIDLILGGHDHIFEIKDVNGTKIIKSGSDFRQFSKITLYKDSDDINTFKIIVEKIDVTSKLFGEDMKLKEILLKYTDVIEEKMNEVLGNFTVELDGRFSTIRTQETNLGNWVCDVVLAATGADIVIINSGTFRSDQIHLPGPFTMRDLVTIVPMSDPLILIEITGKCLYEALENAVSSYPKLEGRFPQVSGISFAFDPTRQPGHRVYKELIQIADEYLNEEQLYKICIKSYMYNGCDGFTMFKNAKIIMNTDSSPELGLAIRNHFKAINIRTCKTGHNTKHRQSLITLSRRHSMIQILNNTNLYDPPHVRRLSAIYPTGPPHVTNTNSLKVLRRASLEALELNTCQLAPKLEQRIIIIQNEEHHKQLLLKKENFINSKILTEAEDE